MILEKAHENTLKLESFQRNKELSLSLDPPPSPERQNSDSLAQQAEDPASCSQSYDCGSLDSCSTGILQDSNKALEVCAENSNILELGSNSSSKQVYNYLEALDNSFQINGNIGESRTLSPLSTTYIELTARGNSIQLNGHVFNQEVLKEICI